MVVQAEVMLSIPELPWIRLTLLEKAQAGKCCRKHNTDHARQHRGSINTSAPFVTCPNCQIGDTDTIWLLIIGSWRLMCANLVVCATDLSIGAPHVWNLSRADPRQWPVLVAWPPCPFRLSWCGFESPTSGVWLLPVRVHFAYKSAAIFPPAGVAVEIATRQVSPGTQICLARNQFFLTRTAETHTHTHTHTPLGRASVANIFIYIYIHQSKSVQNEKGISLKTSLCKDDLFLELHDHVCCWRAFKTSSGNGAIKLEKLNWT